MNRHTSQNWATLPGHLLQKVFAQCDVFDRISVEKVCSHWKTAISYADMTMIDLKEIFPKIKKQNLEICDCMSSCKSEERQRWKCNERHSFCVIQPSALTLCLDFLHKRRPITRLTCSPVDGACGKYSCLIHTKLPYLLGCHAPCEKYSCLMHNTQHMLVFPARYWMLDMTVLDFLARECGDTLEALDLSHCAVDGPTLATLHSQGFPRLVKYSSGRVNDDEEFDGKLEVRNFPALKSLNFTLISALCTTALPAQLTTLRLCHLKFPNYKRHLNLCILEQCLNLEELYLINLYFREQEFRNKEFRLENLKILCFEQRYFLEWPEYDPLIEILSVAPALHTLYWGMEAKISIEQFGPYDMNYFHPPEMFVSTTNLKVLGLGTRMPMSGLHNLLISFPHLQVLSLDFYDVHSLTELSDALVKGALQLEELNLVGYFHYISSFNSLSVLPNLKRIRFHRSTCPGAVRNPVTAAALSELPTTVNQVTIDDGSTLRVLQIPQECSDRRSLFANFLGDADGRFSTDSDSDDAASKKPEKKIKRRKK